MPLYLKQLLAGRDFATTNNFASQMANFVYLVGDEEQRICMVVDPAWDIPGIVEFIDREEMELTGALITHYHPDHVGGEILGHRIAGLSELLAIRAVKVHVNEVECEGLKQLTGLSESDLRRHRGGDVVTVGGVKIELLHTPGHTPGSQCFLVDSALVSGDTLFIGGCGRVDLPGGDSTQMYYSLTRVLSNLPDNTVLFPGHDYAPKPTSTIGEEKRQNQCLRMQSLEDWMSLMGEV